MDVILYGSKASLTSLSTLLISCLLDFQRSALLTNDNGLVEQASPDIKAPIPLTLFQAPLLFSLKSDRCKEPGTPSLCSKDPPSMITHIAVNQNKEIVFALNFSTPNTESEPLTDVIACVSQVYDNMVAKIYDNKRSSPIPASFSISCGNTAAKHF